MPGAREVWLVPRESRTARVDRREQPATQRALPLMSGDTLAAPLLSSFVLPVAKLFHIPKIIQREA